MRIAVYGSLLSGLHNHPILKGAKFIGQAKTRARFVMLDFGSYPACIQLKYHGTQIVVEVYEVDAKTLQLLDRLESHPTMYRRQPVSTYIKDTHMYVFQQRIGGGAEIIKSGDWRQHFNAKLARHRVNQMA